eukprot:5873482-Pleurochrysis_carterae.AAC.2
MSASVQLGFAKWLVAANAVRAFLHACVRVCAAWPSPLGAARRASLREARVASQGASRGETTGSTAPKSASRFDDGSVASINRAGKMQFSHPSRASLRSSLSPRSP